MEQIDRQIVRKRFDSWIEILDQYFEGSSKRKNKIDFSKSFETNLLNEIQINNLRRFHH